MAEWLSDWLDDLNSNHDAISRYVTPAVSNLTIVQFHIDIVAGHFLAQRYLDAWSVCYVNDC